MGVFFLFRPTIFFVACVEVLHYTYSARNFGFQPQKHTTTSIMIKLIGYIRDGQVSLTNLRCFVYDTGGAVSMVCMLRCPTSLKPPLSSTVYLVFFFFSFVRFFRFFRFFVFSFFSSFHFSVFFFFSFFRFLIFSFFLFFFVLFVFPLRAAVHPLQYPQCGRYGGTLEFYRLHVQYFWGEHQVRYRAFCE